MQNRTIVPLNERLAYNAAIVYDDVTTFPLYELAESVGGSAILFAILREIKRPEHLLALMFVSKAFYKVFSNQTLWEKIVRTHRPDEYQHLKHNQTTIFARKRMAAFLRDSYNSKHAIPNYRVKLTFDSIILSGDLDEFERAHREFPNYRPQHIDNIARCGNQALRDYYFQHFVSLDNEQIQLIAVECNQIAFIRDLIDNKIITTDTINVSLMSNHGNTLLRQAASYGHLELVKLLLNAGAEPNIGQITPLICAALENHSRVVQTLIEHGAIFSTADNLTERDTPLIAAAKKGYYRTIRVLIDNKANLNVRGQDGKTALDHALTIGDERVAQALLNAGAVMNRELIFEAIQNNRLNTLNLILKINPDINLNETINPDAPRSGITPLIDAVQSSNYGAFLRLVEAGADINLANDEGLSPIVCAALSNKLDFVTKLIELGADCTTLFKYSSYSYYKKNNIKYDGSQESHYRSMVDVINRAKLAYFIKNAKTLSDNRNKQTSTHLGIKLSRENGNLYKAKFTLFGRTFRIGGYSSTKKLAAANALENALLDHTPIKTLKKTEHKDVLNKGELKTIYRAFTK